MRILIEEHQYPAELVQDVLHGVEALQGIEGRVSLSYVGYFYNTKLRDCVFILPKVLMNEQDRVFGKYSPEEMIHFEKMEPALTDEERKFIYEFAVWIYRTIVVYRNSHEDSGIVYHKKLIQPGKGRRKKDCTFLDIVLALLQFNRENQNFFFFILRNMHSGFNKINWTRTISHSQAIIQDGAPIYLNPVNKKRLVNFDEELLIIFFSILNYVGDEYGFEKNINCNFTLITGRKFEAYMKGLGKVRLQQIKYKYFSDKALELWELCYAFFCNSNQVYTSTTQQEYLLVKNFYIVFEAIIDELIGSREDKAALPTELTEQKDGKLVDHLYTYKALMQPEEGANETYYIGDSKYYKIGAQLGDHSIYKQYTYARNIIQSNIDLWMDDKRDNPDIKVRCDHTEGYNILPNFFISAAMVEDDYSYTHREVHRLGNTEIKYHFPDRLFDRDTLLLSRYNVNFLFVIALYARNKQTEKAAWKAEVREQFRREIQNVLNTHYKFFAMKSKGNALASAQFIDDHFRELQGKLFCPFEDKTIYAMALEREEATGVKDAGIHDLLSEHFIIEEMTLGQSPKESLEASVVQYQAEHPYSPVPESWLPQYHVGRYAEENFVIGSYHDQAHWDWITGKNDRGTLIYNVRLDAKRDGAQVKTRLKDMKVKFAILYQEGHEDTYHVFRVHDTAIMPEERMRQSQYPREPKGDYFIFRFDEEVTIGDFDIARLIGLHRLSTADYKDGTPIFVKGEELLKYRK